MREREDANRTREAGNRDEVEGVVANTMSLFRNVAVGFIDWLDPFRDWTTGNDIDIGDLPAASCSAHEIRSATGIAVDSRPVRRVRRFVIAVDFAFGMSRVNHVSDGIRILQVECR